MRILISGAAGFLGSNLTDLLLGQGHQVVGVDNFITGKRENIAHLSGHPGYEFIEHDVIDPLQLDGPVDRVFHLASPATTVGYLKNQVATLKANSVGTCNLLDLALQKSARFLMASTSEIYGDASVSPQPETYWGYVNSIGLRSMYDEAKRFSETCVMAYHRERHGDTRIIRIFNTYGPRMDPYDGRVVTTFVRQALSDEPITVYGDGTQARSLCYVSDTLSGLLAAMEADFHEPINIGNPDQVTIVQLAREILELIPQSKSRIAFATRPDYDPRVLKPDLMRAKTILGWSPRISRREGLANMIESVRQRRADMPRQA
jgi:dTDP-glucose 4,6-dehydratase